MAIPKGGGIDPGGWADPIGPNLLSGFPARRLLHYTANIYISMTTVIQMKAVKTTTFSHTTTISRY